MGRQRLEGTPPRPSGQGWAVTEPGQWAAGSLGRVGALGHGFLPAAGPGWSEPGFKAYDWDKTTVLLRFSSLPSSTSSIIGARTSLSSGKGTVAEEVRRRGERESRRSVLVITEDTEKMNQAKWDQLVAPVSGGHYRRLPRAPGLKFFDENGNRNDTGRYRLPPRRGVDERLRCSRIEAIWHFSPHFLLAADSRSHHPKEGNPSAAWYLGKCKGFAATAKQQEAAGGGRAEFYLEMMRLRFDEASSWPCT